MEKGIIPDFLKQVKKNKKYSSIADEIILEEISNYLKKNKIEKITKQDIKEIRKNLHRIYSSYIRGKKSKRNKILEELKNSPDNLEMINRILATAVSTKERLDCYPKIYSEIFRLTIQPRTIMDIGCGLNPVSYLYMNLKELNYYAYDIDNEDIDFLNDFFQIQKPFGLNGKAQILNARNLKEISHLPSTDIVFLWKLIDLINTKNSKPSEELIKILINKTRFIVASFATRTIGGKPMNLPRRKGFELMLERNNLKFQTIKISNEIFYVISKN
jgi:16S rRNA (guanine(1405)-N(7))-methyltransferase